jgi:DNA-binding NtrC family response regulator
MAQSGTIRVLAVDDSEIVLDTYRLCLGEEMIDTAPTVGEAVAKLDADPSLRIIVADFNMSDGGLPFLRTLRSRYPDRLLIVMSGDPSALGAAAAGELGIYRWIDKGRTSVSEMEEILTAAAEELAACRPKKPS